MSQIVQGFYKLNLRPYLERIEASVKRHLMPSSDWDSVAIEFDFDALLRADQAAGVPDGDRPALLRRHREAMGGVHRWAGGETSGGDRGVTTRSTPVVLPLCVRNGSKRLDMTSRTALLLVVLASPAVADNQLYLRSIKHLYCIAE